MKNFLENRISLGDIIKINGRKNSFIVVSNNTYNNNSCILYVCPIVTDTSMGPFHVCVEGENGTRGIAVCENVLPINTDTTSFNKIDHIPYAQVMEISDIIQGIFEYD